MATETPVPAPMELDRRLLKQCVHCGLCLDACPTYRVLKIEMDSPRGRIYQIKAAYEGKIDPNDAHYQEHIYGCLDCRACQTICPAGVQYGKIIEAARGLTPPARSERSISRTILSKVFTSNKALDRIGTATRLYQRSGLQSFVRKSGLLNIMPRGLRNAESMLGDIQGGVSKVQVPDIIPAQGERRYRVGMISGCVMSQLMGETNLATARVLSRNGCEVVIPTAQRCCGALHVHGGERDGARELASKNIEVFEQADVDYVIINAAGCGSTLKEYGELFRGEPEWHARAEAFSDKVRDISEFLVQIGLRTEGLGELKLKVTYQDPCHLVHGQGIRNQPRELLKAIPGLELVEMIESDQCCGSAGIYNITHYDLSMQILEPKLGNIERTGASVVVAPNPGCAMQIAGGLRKRGDDVQVAHVVDLLERSYQAGEAHSAPV
ncbi:MAG TPA: (Fe-S)-binding protein [Chloroflexota bacterium]|nr:(Fe-S)-binding protein [Chloroflexota bacterium]